MSEVITLDPPEVAANRTELDLNSDAIRILEAGPDWGTAEIAPYMAEQSRGESPVDYRIPNRQVQIPLRLGGGTLSFDDARRQVQNKVARIQAEGGWLKREAAGGTLFLDLVNASLSYSSGYQPTMGSYDPEVVLSLEAIPDFYGSEVTLSDHTEASAAELIFTETDIKGDYPGRVRMVVDEDESATQRSLFWGMRSRHYSADAAAALAYECEALTPYASVAGTAVTGASGGTVAQHATVGTAWTNILSTQISGGSHLLHTGSYRVYIRARSTTAADTTSLRFQWAVGDLSSPTTNTSAAIPLQNSFVILDLGEVRLQETPVGTHQWVGAIQAKGTTTARNVQLDRLWLVPFDEGWGLLTAPTASDGVLMSGQSAELRHDGCYREISTGTNYAPLPYVIGDLPRIPPSGLEDRTVQVFLKASRGLVGEEADSAIDNISAQVFYRASYLFVPEA